MQHTHTPTRADIDASHGPLVLEFGAAWCDLCVDAAPAIADVAWEHPQVPLVQIEDGPGRPLGRSFGIKLWPTFVFLRDGTELARIVRPRSAHEVSTAFERLENGESLADLDDSGPTDFGGARAYAGKPRGFGGGRYAAAYSGSYGGDFRDDYRGTRSDTSGRFRTQAKPDANTNKNKAGGG